MSFNTLIRICHGFPGADQSALATIMDFNKIIQIPEKPLKADNAVSKINTDYETNQCAAMASSIIQLNF
jgi:hypothetical protein